jgi:hypothetical protein
MQVLVVMAASKPRQEAKYLDLHTSKELTGLTRLGLCLARIVRIPDAAALALGFLIGCAVCAPLIDGGRVFLLDWSFGTHTPLVTPQSLGLYGGLTAGSGGSAMIALLNNLFGSAATWLPILIFFPIATLGAGRMAGGSRWSRMAAGTLYAVNPFVFNRLYAGHLPLLIGYALLPFAIRSALRSSSSRARLWTVPALWWAALTSLSPHFAWIFGLVVVAVPIVAVFTKEHPVGHSVRWFATVTGMFALMSSYLVLPSAVTNLPTQLGRASLAIYRTSGDPHLGLFSNVLSLYGFWRIGPGPLLPKSVISGWPFLMLAIILIAIYGVWSAVWGDDRRVVASLSECDVKGCSPLVAGGAETSGYNVPDQFLSERIDRRRLAILLMSIAGTSFFLALGDQGPTGWLFLWAYSHVPFFALMREPQKFLMLLALAYAVLFGWGVERLSRVAAPPSRASAIAVATLLGIALPLGYTYNIFLGLGGQITTNSIPRDYRHADSLMGTGPGNILSLPWHLYLEYPFTDGRVVANVAPTSFRRNVISGDNVEASGVESQSTSPRSAYLQQLFANGTRIQAFGTLVAPLGVKYVVLAKTVDWPSYSWLNDQTDLKLVLNTSALEVWRNTAYTGVGHRVVNLTSVSNFGGLLTLAKSDVLNGGAVVVNGGSSSLPARLPKGRASTRTSTNPPTVVQLSPIAYRIAPGKVGWVTVDAPYQRGWSLNGRSASATAEGTVLVRVGKSGGILEFTPWRLVRLGYVVSAGTFLALVVVLIVDRRRTARVLKMPKPPPL